MADAIIAFLSRITGNKALVSALLAVIPVTEIKGSILYVAASEGAVVLPVLAAYGASLILAVALAFAVPKVLARTERLPLVGRLTRFLTDRLSKRADRLFDRADQKGERRKNVLTFGVFAFVAVPLPLTGIWAGALLASLLRLDPKNAFFALATGNFCAAGIVLTVALLAGEKASLVFDLFLVLAIAFLFAAVAKSLFRKRKIEKG